MEKHGLVTRDDTGWSATSLLVENALGEEAIKPMLEGSSVTRPILSPLEAAVPSLMTARFAKQAAELFAGDVHRVVQVVSASSAT